MSSALQGNVIYTDGLDVYFFGQRQQLCKYGLGFQFTSLLWNNNHAYTYFHTPSAEANKCDKTYLFTGKIQAVEIELLKNLKKS